MTGWRPWSGGACPTDMDARVNLQFRCGRETKNPVRAGNFIWADRGEPFDIVAYQFDGMPEEVQG